jgi:transposase-like protein
LTPNSIQSESRGGVDDYTIEKVREDGLIRSRAVMVAIGINRDGRRCVLAVDLANRESQTSWKEFALGLKGRGLTGVERVLQSIGWSPPLFCAR